MNYNNLAQKTNYIAGSDKLKLAPFYLTNVNLPGLTFSYPEISGRFGSKVFMAGDNIQYNSLSFEMLIDEDFNLYNEFLDKILENINVETGTFADNTFDFWIEINNNKGNKIMKFEFYNCRIESLGDIQLDTQDDITEHTITVEVRYDYFKRITNNSVPTLNI